MISLYFGSPGSGKTTLIMYQIKKQIKRFSSLFYKIFDRKPYRFYTNVKDCSFPYYSSENIGKNALPPYSTLYIDEAGIDFNSRAYKSMSKDQIAYFKLHRHYKHDINFYSQSWEDCDITIRRLCDRYYHLTKLGPFTLVRRVRKFCTIDSNTQQIIDGYKFTGLLWRLIPSFLGGFKSWFLVFRPLYYQYFDSYAIDKPLPEVGEGERVRVTHAHRPKRSFFASFDVLKKKYKNYIEYRFPWLDDEFRGHYFDRKRQINDILLSKNK